MAFTHFGESADAYVSSLAEDRDQFEFAKAYLKHLREGGPLVLPRGQTDSPLYPTVEYRIINRLRNTGTSQDFARRAIGGTMGTFRAKSTGRTASRTARRAGRR